MPPQRCPCGSRKAYKRCCAPLHQGRPAPTAEALMRSRYSAFKLGLVDYLIDTTATDGPQFQPNRQGWADELAFYCRNTQFTGLQVHEHTPGETESYVRFTASLTQKGEPYTLEEHSRFTLQDGRWVYHSAI